MSYPSLSVRDRAKAYENKNSQSKEKIVPLNKNSDVKVRDFVTMHLRQDTDLDDPNKVYMSEKSLKTLYPSWTNKSNEPKYISLAGYIFKVLTSKCEDNEVFIDTGHVVYCGKDLNESQLPVHKVKNSFQNIPLIKKIKLAIKLEKQHENAIKTDFSIEFKKKDLVQFFLKNFSDEYLSLEKTYYFENSAGKFSFVVTGIDFKEKKQKEMIRLPGKIFQNHGRINKDTNFVIVPKQTYKVKVMEETAKKEWIKQLNFQVSSKDNLSLYRPKDYVTPYVIDIHDAISYLKNRYIKNGKSEEISIGKTCGMHDSNSPCYYNFTKATVDPTKFKNPVNAEITKSSRINQNFEFTAKNIYFEYPSNIIMTDREKGVLIADEMELDLEDIKGKVYSDKHCFISVKELKEQLSKSKNEFACGQSFIIRLNGKE